MTNAEMNISRYWESIKMNFKFLNKLTGKQETKKFDSLDQVVESSLMSEAIKTEIERLRGTSLHAKHKAYITVIKNEGREDEQYLCQAVPNQLQDDGRDDMHNALWENQGAATQLGFTHMGVSDNAAGLPADSATTMLGEIVSGGLERADADTTTHGVGTATTLVEHTFTASGSHTAVQKGALFDANAAGTMGIIFLFTSANLVSSDTLKVSVTITLND